MSERSRQSAPDSWRARLFVRFGQLLARLPWPALMVAGDLFGRLAWRLAKSRRRIAETNIALCFPELPSEAQEKLAYQSVHGAGLALIEAFASYFKPGLDLSARLDVTGIHHLHNARATGRGVLLLGMHFDTIDIAAHLLGLALDRNYDAVYRPNDNPALDQIIREGRGRHLDKSFDRADLRGIVRALRNGEVVWYAPDQDYGRRHSIFVPFFGVPAATITATSRIARMSNALVLPLAQSRQPGGRYRLEFGPVLEGFPSDDDEADAARVNALIEHYVRKEPGQYLWVHRRFKHQPEGSVSPYRARK